jgi:hypothetical protein
MAVSLTQNRLTKLSDVLKRKPELASSCVLLIGLTEQCPCLVPGLYVHR